MDNFVLQYYEVSTDGACVGHSLNFIEIFKVIHSFQDHHKSGFPRRGRQPLCFGQKPAICQDIYQKCIEMKEIGPRGARVRWEPSMSFISIVSRTATSHSLIK